MLQAVLNIARYRARAGTPGIRTASYTLNAQNFQWVRHQTNSVDKFAKLRVLATLDPSNNSAARQEVLDVSEESEVILSCRFRPDAPVRIRYSTVESFPSNTRGVLYYVPTKQYRHIRFRLCDSVDDFLRGSDLLKSNGETWSLSLEMMTSRFRQHRPLLDMIIEEHPPSTADIDRDLFKRRIIKTLSPQEFAAKGQTVFDISDKAQVNPQFSAPNILGSAIGLIQYFMGGVVRFPANTKGVFYYKQSTTAPYLIGEIRFRLCSDIASFGSGRDLCLPSGLPWCISSDQLLSKPSYLVIQKQLLYEGLLKPPHPIYVDASSGPVICNLNQPFVVDLAHSRTLLRFKVGANIGKELIFHLFGSQAATPYTGRAVVQFEKYPTEYLRGRCLKQDPLFALRFLEFLTPVDAKPDVESSRIGLPKVGGLLIRRYRSHYFPWGYFPRSSTVYEQLSNLTDQSRFILNLVKHAPLFNDNLSLISASSRSEPLIHVNFSTTCCQHAFA